MAGKKTNRRRRWRRLLKAVILTPIIVITVLTIILYAKQDQIVQHLIETANADFHGKVGIKDSHISLFANFPYISIDIEGLTIHESKSDSAAPLVEIEDAYLGFDLWTVVSGNFDIKKVKLQNGALRLIQHTDGQFNLMRALESPKPVDPAEEFHLNLRQIKLEHIDITKWNEANDLLVEAYVHQATAQFKTSPDHLYANLDARFDLSLMHQGKNTFIHEKHFELTTALDIDQQDEVMRISPSQARLEGSAFDLAGTVALQQDMDLDLKFSGQKPNFDLFIAMAPNELHPILKGYENEGAIFFDVAITGKSANGNKPHVEAVFGCEKAFIHNFNANKRVDDLSFQGTFTNGSECDLQTMEFKLQRFNARPEAGKFAANLEVKNFAAPEIHLKLDSDFDLNFLVKFLNLHQLRDLKGKVALTMNFDDIIDLAHPETAISKLNESYSTQLNIQDLSFVSDQYPLPITDIDLQATMDGHRAIIQRANCTIAKSSLQLTGLISDLPAILHHTDQPVTVQLDLTSPLLDIFELTGGDSATSFQEQVKNLRAKIHFQSTARAFTESPHLPIGEFFVDDLYADLQHYPHRLHDFHADIYVEDQDFRVVDFSGMVDESDFHFNGKLSNYGMWFDKEPKGDTRVEFYLKSALLRLEDVFSYRGENYVPEDYRHEELRNLLLHGITDLHFNQGLQAIDLIMDRMDATMKLHAHRFEQFKGRIHYEDQHLVVENFSGRLGQSDFEVTLHYYLGENELVRKRDNHLTLRANRIMMDEIFLYNPPPVSPAAPVDHDAGFNLYTLPFTHMTFDLQVGDLQYHRYKLRNFKAQFRTTTDHQVHFQDLRLEAAGGSLTGSLHINGSDPKRIYAQPNLSIQQMDLDQLLFKFENFGQEHIVAENLHGKLSGKLTGDLHLHADGMPKLDDSKLAVDINVVNGRLENYPLLNSLADYFQDKNLSSVRFDTLSNQFQMENGTITIPKMTIASSIGFLEISGKQDLDLRMEYFVRIPWKMVTQAAASKLFGKKTEEVDPEQVDAIQFADPEKKVKYLNIKVTGTPEDYSITLGKEKKEKRNRADKGK